MSRADEVRAAVAEHLQVERELLADDTSLGEDLGLDSLAGIELATALEDRFALRITDDELAAVRTYGDLERVMRRRPGRRPRPGPCGARDGRSPRATGRPRPRRSGERP